MPGARSRSWRAWHRPRRRPHWPRRGLRRWTSRPRALRRPLPARSRRHDPADRRVRDRQHVRLDSRHRRAAEALAGDGWSVVVVAMAGSGLPAEESWDSGVVVRRPEVDRRLLGAVPAPLRGAVARLLSLPPGAERLPSPGRGATERLRGVLRRGLEIAAFARRVRPWATAAVAAAPEARIWVAKA